MGDNFLNPTGTSEWEDWLFIRFKNRGLGDCLIRSEPYVLDYEKDNVHGTVFDFYWYDVFYVGYLDGAQVHKSLIHNRKDDLITMALEKRGFTVDRWRYSPPLTDCRADEICGEVEETLRRLRS